MIISVNKKKKKKWQIMDKLFYRYLDRYSDTRQAIVKNLT